MVRIVMVHGRDKPFEIQDTVQREWAEALSYGLRRLNPPYDLNTQPTLAWYGDVWRPDDEGERSWGDAAGDVELDAERSVAASPATSLQADLIGEMLGARGVALPVEDEERERGLLGTLSEIIGKLEPYLPDALARQVLQRFLYDINDYFYKPDVRQRVLKRVADEIRAANDKVVLLAHSMGCIVSYDVLINRGNVLMPADASLADYPVAAFISFGCPLGFKSVRNNVVDSQGKTPFPLGLSKWVNVYNREDFVAAVREIGGYYTSGDSRRIEDKDEGQGIPPNPFHLISGHDPRVYLSSMALVKSLRSIVESRSIARVSRRGPQAYCVKDRKMVDMKDPREITLKNGRKAMQGVCPICGTKVTSIGAARPKSVPLPSPISRISAPTPGKERGDFAVKGSGAGVSDGGNRADTSAEAPSTATARTIERTASADFPGVVEPGSSNLLSYAIAKRKVFERPTSIRMQVPQDVNEVKLRVSVEARDFVILDPDTRQPRNVDYPEENLLSDDAKIYGSFLLRARQVDGRVDAKIYLRFWYKNRPVGQIEIPTSITDLAADAPQERASGASGSIRWSFNEMADADIVLTITANPDNSYDIQADRNGRYDGKPLGRFPTTGKAWEYARFILDKFRTARALQPPELRQTQIDDLGFDLWSQLPQAFQEFYWRQMHGQKGRDGRSLSIAIYSQEPYIPWELIKPQNRATGETADMFGLQFSIARWKQAVDFPEPLTVSSNGFAVIAPMYADNLRLEYTQDEANDLQTQFGARSIDATFAQVTSLLRSKDTQVIHFAGHGKFDPATTDDSQIMLADSPLRPLNVPLRPPGPEPKPLVFINACEVGEQGWSLTQIGGWGEKFCEQGFSAFIGPYWAVNDQVARKAALLFYNQLKVGNTVGEALQEIRSRFWGDDEFRYHPTWLAYTLHCQPNVIVTFG